MSAFRRLAWVGELAHASALGRYRRRRPVPKHTEKATLWVAPTIRISSDFDGRPFDRDTDELVTEALRAADR